MTFRGLGRIAVLAGALLQASTADADWTLPQVRTTYKEATLFIEIEVDGRVSATGSGIVLNETGFVLSAKHLLSCLECRNRGTFWATSSASGRMPLKLIAEEGKHDLALFQLAAQLPWKGGKLPSIGAPVEAGRQLFVLGFPASPGNAYPYVGYDGKLGSDPLVDGRWQTDLPISPGNSGGPVFDVSGSLVGIALSGVPGQEGTKFVAPIKLAERLLRIASVPLPETFGMPAPDLITLFIDASAIKGRREVIDSLLDAVQNLGNDLRTIRLTTSSDQANYTLTLKEVRSFAGNFLILDALYGSPSSPAQAAAGKCNVAGCRERDGPDVALKDLLENTLLHPLYGFYRQMNIESCERAKDQRYVSLNVKWNSGAGLTQQDALYYEVGELSGKADESPSPTSYYVDVQEVLKREKSSARARFFVLPTSGSYRLRACDQVGQVTNEVLMVRMKPRSLPETAANSNPASFVSQKR